MRVIDEIIKVEKRHSTKGKYYITFAMSDGDEVRGWSESKDFYKVGDRIEVFFDDRWNVAKMQKYLT